MPRLSLDDALAIPDDVTFRELAGEAVILDMASGTYFGLDTVGTRIWQLIGEGQRLSDVYATLVEEYEADPRTLQDDLLEFAAQLCLKGLLRKDAPNP